MQTRSGPGNLPPVGSHLWAPRQAAFARRPVRQRSPCSWRREPRRLKRRSSASNMVAALAAQLPTVRPLLAERPQMPAAPAHSPSARRHKPRHLMHRHSGSWRDLPAIMPMRSAATRALRARTQPPSARLRPQPAATGQQLAARQKRRARTPQPSAPAHRPSPPTPPPSAHRP